MNPRTIREAKDNIRKKISSVTERDEYASCIPIVKTLKKERFVKDFARKAKPVVISSAAADWPLTNQLDRFIADFSNEPCVYRRGEYSTGIEGRGLFEKFSSTIGAYTAELDRDGWEDNSTYASYQIAGKEMIELLRYPDWLPIEYVRNPIHYWLGPAGTYTAMHSDTCDKIVYQAVGWKEWVLVVPHSACSLYLIEDFGRGFDVTNINAFSPDYVRFPKLKDVVFLHFVVQSGDLFFLPGGWYHSVRSKSKSLSFEFKSDAVPYSVTKQEERDSYLRDVERVKASISL